MLIEFAAAIQIMSSAFRSFSSMNWEDIGKAALAFTVVLGEITAAVKILQYSGKSFGNDVSVSTGLMLIELATSLEIIVDVVKKLADIDANGISKSLVVLGVILAELAAFTVIVSGSKNMMLIATSMVIMGVALEVIADVIEKLAAIKPKSLAQSLVVLAGTFVVLAVAANLLSGSVGIILALSAALVLLGAGLTLIGVGVTAISVGISSLGASLTVAVTGIVASILILVEGLASLIPIGLRIAKEWITGICEVIVESVPAIGEAIKAIVLTVCDVVDECAPQLISTILTLLLILFDALAEYAPQIVDKLVTFLIGVIDTLTAKVPEHIDSIANLISAFVHAIMEQLEKIDTSTLIQSIAVVGMIAALMYALSGLGSLLGPAMVGVLAAGVIIAEIALVLAAIGGLNQISGLQWLISEGGDLLEAIGVAIGQFIGGITGGIMTGITGQFGEIGTDLSEFMENAQPFIDGASSINASMLNGVMALMKAILLLTAADILSGIASWITGDSSIGEFAEELVPFGEAMVKFADTVDGLDANVIENAATAGKALTELANTVPNTGGVVGWFVGENDLDDFGEKLVAFGEGMKSFADSVKDLDTETVVNAATAGEALIALADTVPNTGGVVGWFVGENDLDIFGDQLVTFGEGMKLFSESVKGIDTNAIVNAATVGESLTALADTVPNTGGVVEFFTGNNDLDTFGDQLSDFGKGMKSFASSVKGIDTKAVSNAATAGKALATFANSLPTTGGVVGWFMGEQDMGTYGEQFVPFGKAMKGFSDTVTGMDAEAVTASAKAGQALAELAASLPTEGGVFSWFTGETMDMSTFGTQLVGFGEGLKAYSDAITADDGLDANAIESSATAAAALSELASGLPTEGGVFSWFTGDTINIDEFGEKLPAFGEGLKAYNDAITAD
ncbi:MAG: phage tail tape measure protein, partial [Ruminococcus sp.]|nr:phage tail tape measure protein [Ruminococcus sp.]